MTNVRMSGTIADHGTEGEHFDLRAARGFALVVAISAAFWVAVALAI